MPSATDLQQPVRPIPMFHIAILATLVLAQLACAAMSSIASSDTSRDVFFAQQIASGQAFPLTGPAINGMVHLGPLWYYLLAPAGLLPNAGAITGLMGLLSATQFPLAYLLGRRLGQPHEGLLFALALALPAWIVTSFASLTHPMIVVPSLLLAVHALLSYRRRPDAWRAGAIGCVLVLMYTGHPTLVLFGAFLCGCAFFPVRSWRRTLAHMAVVLTIVVIPFLPMLYEQWKSDFADVELATAYARSEWTMPSLIEASRLIYASIVHGPRYLGHYWLQLSPPAALTLIASQAAVLLLATIGLLAVLRRDPMRRRLILLLIALLLVQSMFLAAIRDMMPPWMTYSNWPLIAALIALGLAAGWHALAWRGLVGVLLAVSCGWTIAAYSVVAAGPTTFLNLIPSPGKNGFMDIRDYEEGRGQIARIARIPFRDVYELGPSSCEPVTLYGHYAFLVDYTYSIAASHACGSNAHVRFGGRPAPGEQAWIGLHRMVWEALGMGPERWLSDVGITAPVAIEQSEEALLSVTPTFSNFPRVLTGTVETFTLEFDAAAHQAVLAGHRTNRYQSFDLVRAFADGVARQPVYTDPTLTVLAPLDSSSNTVRWRLELRGNPRYVDVLRFESAPAGGIASAEADAK